MNKKIRLIFFIAIGFFIVITPIVMAAYYYDILQDGTINIEEHGYGKKVFLNACGRGTAFVPTKTIGEYQSFLINRSDCIESVNWVLVRTNNDCTCVENQTIGNVYDIYTCESESGKVLPDSDCSFFGPNPSTSLPCPAIPNCECEAELCVPSERWDFELCRCVSIIG